MPIIAGMSGRKSRKSPGKLMTFREAAAYLGGSYEAIRRNRRSYGFRPYPGLGWRTTQERLDAVLLEEVPA